MSKVQSQPVERDILAVIRELESGSKREIPKKEGIDPVELRENIKTKLEFVCIVEKTKLKDLVEGSLGGKSIADVKKDLSLALLDLDDILDKSAKG